MAAWGAAGPAPNAPGRDSTGQRIDHAPGRDLTGQGLDRAANRPRTGQGLDRPVPPRTLGTGLDGYLAPWVDHIKLYIITDMTICFLFNDWLVVI